MQEGSFNNHNGRFTELPHAHAEKGSRWHGALGASSRDVGEGLERPRHH